ncbi:hypothetical protein MKW92_010284 [Papaver armeniacum]|nr:hypothetical protein MKW92_010284 [Papaver armeniacum]
MGNHSPNPEHRLRLSGSFEDSNNKRRFLRSKSSKEVEKPYLTYTQEKSSKCKVSTLKLVLLIIIFEASVYLSSLLATFLTLSFGISDISFHPIPRDLPISRFNVQIATLVECHLT